MSTSHKPKQDNTTTSSKHKNAHSAASPSKLVAFFQYFEDAKKELSKVSWPTKGEIKVTGLAVLAMIVVMAIFLGLADFILVKVVAAILSLGA